MTPWSIIMKLVNKIGGHVARVGNSTYIRVGDQVLGPFIVQEGGAIDAENLQKITAEFEKLGYDKEFIEAVIGINGDPVFSEILRTAIANLDRLTPSKAKELYDMEILRDGDGNIVGLRIGNKVYHRLLPIIAEAMREAGLPIRRSPISKDLRQAIQNAYGEFDGVDYQIRRFKFSGLRGRAGEEFIEGDIEAFKNAVRRFIERAKRYIQEIPVEEEEVEVSEGDVILESLAFLLDAGILSSDGRINIKNLLRKIRG